MPLLALWSFASPWLLLWGVTAALPILIHLWSRRRYVETPWAATQFLLAAIRLHRRRIQIEQWLLLAIRALVLLLLAIALAEPLVSGLPGISDPTRESPTHTILVVDTSYSMAYENAGKSRLSEARSRAAKLVEDAAPGDAFSLVRLADPPEVIIGEPSVSHDAVRDEFNRLQITNRGADLAATLEQVEQLINAAATQFEDQRLYVISDLGKTTWSDSPPQDWRSRLASISERATCQLSAIDTRGTPENTAVTRLRLPSGTLNVGASVSVEVDVANFSNRPQLRKRIELVVDGQSVGEQFVDLESGGRATASFAVTLNVAGDHLLKASIGDDGLKLDNVRWLAVPVRDAIRVLCIQGRPHAAEYIALALQPASVPEGISAEVTSEHAILDRALSEYDCIFLCNVARFTPDEAEQLRRYVEQGGGLVLVLGDLVRPDVYNQQLGIESPTKLLPARLNEIVTEGRHAFNPLEYRHPLTLPFRGHERAGLLTVPIWRYIRLDQINDAAAVVLAFDNGDPAFVEMGVGQGRVLLFATAASPESVDQSTDPPTPWTALASWPSFPPLVHEIVRFAASNRAAQRNVLVGDVLVSQLPSTVTNATGTLTTPNDVQVPLRFQGAEQVWTYHQTDQPGAYRLTFADEVLPPALFTVNLDTRESDLELVPVEGLENLFDEAIQPDIAPTSVVERDVSLFRLALGGLLVLLVAETFLACHSGRASR